MPCNAPVDFCRMGSGWQTMQAETLTRIASIAHGAPALGAAIGMRPDGRLEIRPPQPFPLGVPKLENTRPRLEWYRTREAHSLINNTWLELFESRCPHIIYDVGSETFARLEIRLHSGGPAIIAISTGESLNEVKHYARRVTDIFELKDGESFATAPTGFRYVKVMVLSAAGEQAVFEAIEVQHISYPVEHAGQFHCSDETLNAIFTLSSRTLHLCMQNEIWDGIKRDQLPWMGDLYTEALAAYTLFGDYRLARRSLAVLAEIGPADARLLTTQRYPGLTAIWKTASGDINDIPSYTLWWVVGLWDYWMYSGDSSLLLDLAIELETTLTHIARSVSSDGLWRLTAGWDFVDWAPLSPQERAVYCHLLACRALDMGAELLEAIGRPTESLRNLQAQMVDAARSAWWDEAANQGRFGVSHHVNAQAICSNVLSEEEAAALFAQALQPDPALSMTYWHRYLDLTAARRAGQIRWGLDYIRRHWGQALQVGMTALWEAFDPAWLGDDPHAVSMIGAGYARYGGYETSLCHGWSAGPAVWLQNAILGIKPVAAGFKRFSFSPQLAGLEWANGTIPTPHGLLQVHLQARAGALPVARLEIPEGIHAIIPDQVWREWQIQLINRTQHDSHFKSRIFA